MRESLALRRQLRDSIKSEIAERTKVHQARIAAFKTAHVRPLLAGAAAQPAPLAMLANGDSWFDYPLNGNDISLTGDTDIIAQLGSMGNVNPMIQNVAHFGDATTEELALPKQQRMIQALQDQANWVDGKPDAILFSGGGDDIAGNQFCIYLDYVSSGGPGLDTTRFQGVLDMVHASYLDLFLFRDQYAPGVPIFGHCYDFPIPNGVAPDCAGPWLKPSLTFTGWTVAQGTVILHQAMLAFRAMLQSLAADPANNFTMVDTQGTLVASDWANELHPFPEGFKKLAALFVDALGLKFPGRI